MSERSESATAGDPWLALVASAVADAEDGALAAIALYPPREGVGDTD